MKMLNTMMLPCPFCGGRPKMYVAYGNDSHRYLKCTGTGCPSSLMSFHGANSQDSIENEKEAIRKWNSRHVSGVFTN